MTIREIEEATGLPRANVRYYESLGLIHPARSANGYRDYRQEDLDTLLKIKLLRQLDCPLEDIQALEQGARTLEQVLSELWLTLEQKQTETLRARELCQQLRDDRPSWSSLQPERYLSMEFPPVRDASDSLGSRCPWRRYLARTMDFALCDTVWALFLCLVPRVNVLSTSLWLDVLSTAMAFVLMCVLEPVFLHFFGATPGKALFRLKLTRSDGSYLGYRDCLRRTVQVVVLGMGLMIPLLNLIALILSYLRCRHRVSQPWALEDESWSDPTGGRIPFLEQQGSVRRVLGYVGCYGAMVVLILLSCLVAATPWHQGSLTSREFADNYNHLLVYASAPGTPAQKLGENGNWYQSASHVFLLTEPPPFQLQETDGRLTQVTFAVSDPEQGRQYPTPAGYAVRILHALLGERELLPGQTLGALDQQLQEVVTGEHTWNIDGWSIFCRSEISGFYSFQDILVPVQDQSQELTYFFSVQRTDTPA